MCIRDSLNGQILQYIFMVLVTTGLGFGLTYAFGYKDEEEVATEVETERLVEEETTGNIPVSLQNETILAPVAGEVVALADVNDPVFSSGAMGQGLAIKPSEGVVYAPADAEVTIALRLDMHMVLKLLMVQKS